MLYINTEILPFHFCQSPTIYNNRKSLQKAHGLIKSSDKL